MFTTAAILLLAAATASAQTATITIEASHGGAGNGLTNTTIEVPLNMRYTNSALDTVSTLYLTGSDGVALDSITCTPYRYNNLTGAGGLPFTSATPSFLSTNTVQVGSLLCNSTSGTTTSSTTASVTSTLSAISNLSTTTNASVIPVTTTARNLTSVYLTTVSPTQSGPSTVTSVFTGSEGPTTSTLTSTVEGGSPTSSASPSLNSESAADGNKVSKWLAQGMAMVGAALVAALRPYQRNQGSILVLEARLIAMARYKCPNCDFEGDLFVIDGHLRHTKKQSHFYRCTCGFKHCDLGKDGMATHVKECAKAQEKLSIGATKDLAKLQRELDTIAFPNTTDGPLQPIQVEQSAQSHTNSAASGADPFDFGNPAFPAVLPYGRSNQPCGPYQTPSGTSSGLRGALEIPDGQDYTGFDDFGAPPPKRVKMSSTARDSPVTPRSQTKRSKKGKLAPACQDCRRRKKLCKHRSSTQTDDGAGTVPAVTARSQASNVDTFGPYGNDLQDPSTASNQASRMQPPFEVPFGSGLLPAQQPAQQSASHPPQQLFLHQSRQDSLLDGYQVPSDVDDQELQKQIELGEAFEEALARPGPQFSPAVPDAFRTSEFTDSVLNQPKTSQPFGNHDLVDPTAGNDFAIPQNYPMIGPLQPYPLPPTKQQLPFATHPRRPQTLQQAQSLQQSAGGTVDHDLRANLPGVEGSPSSVGDFGLPMPDLFEAAGDIVEGNIPGNQQWEDTYPVEQTQTEQMNNPTPSQNPANNDGWGQIFEYPADQADAFVPRAYEQTAETTRAYVEANSTELPQQPQDWPLQAYQQNPNATDANQDEPDILGNVEFEEYGYGFNEKGEIYDL
ncbi:hypothetical protein HII31_04143 [Pseudocercospora fuligena]|uniref:C2H2-type domain-containing protein n=1 Tax=Pseudocercospora fuligena TaxID=685502 RepID=A0A8H6VLD7_9PEZI|nr:hypothetical protein HII31_04143 [Pseudocercospora fuligena]